jgi:hypothetical protein
MNVAVARPCHSIVWRIFPQLYESKKAIVVCVCVGGTLQTKLELDVVGAQDMGRRDVNSRRVKMKAKVRVSRFSTRWTEARKIISS